MGIFDGYRKRRAEEIGKAVNQAVEPVLKNITRSLTDPILAAMIGESDNKTVNKPYEKSVSVYSVIKAISENISQVPFKVYKYSGENKQAHGARQKMAKIKALENKEVESGPIYDLFQSPNPTVNRFQLWEFMSICLDIWGEWFVLPSEETTGAGVPAFLYTYPPNYWEPVINDGAWVGWKLDLAGKKRLYEFEQVLFDKNYNPYDQIRGLSALKPYGLTIETDYQARRYNRNFFYNDGTPPTVYSTDQHLSDDQYRRLRKQLIDSRKGTDNAHTALLLDGGITASNLGLNQRDIQFIEQLKLSIQDACMVFRVPKSEVSVFEDTNYATALASKRSFWESTLIPRMTRIEDEFNRWLRLIGYEGYFDLTQVEALNYAMLERVDAAVKLYSLRALTFKEINDRLDFGFEEQPYHNELPSLYPDLMGYNEDQDETGKAAPPDDSQSKMIDYDRRTLIWKQAQNQTRGIESRMKREIRNYFHSVREKILNEAIKDYKTRDAVIKQKITDDTIDSAFDDDELRRASDKIIRISVDIGADSIQIGQTNPIEGQILDEQVRSIQMTRGEKVTAINDTARAEIRETVNRVTNDAIQEGLSEADTAARLVDELKAAFKNIESRARTIARTEVHGAFSQARHLAIQSTQPRSRMWISSRDGKVRPSHDIDGQLVSGAETYSNGLMYPLDPNGAAGEVINCRCIEYPVYSDEDLEV